MLERRDLLGVGRVDLLLGLAHALQFQRVLRGDHVGHGVGGVELQGGAAFGEGRRRLQGGRRRKQGENIQPGEHALQKWVLVLDG